MIELFPNGDYQHEEKQTFSIRKRKIVTRKECVIADALRTIKERRERILWPCAKREADINNILIFQ